jgi:hypothetical protein
MRLEVYWPVIAGLGVIPAAFGVYLWMRKRPSPAELERRRRETIQEIGKMGDAAILEVQGDLVSYSYSVRGIEYQASQDVSGLETPDQWATIERVSIKYDPRNPANSIILPESWSGLRKTPARN